MIGVLIIVVPAHSAKVSIKSIVGVVRPTRVSTPSRVDVVNIYAHAISRILRRSKISDNIPDGNAQMLLLTLVTSTLEISARISNDSQFVVSLFWRRSENCQAM